MNKKIFIALLGLLSSEHCSAASSFFSRLGAVAQTARTAGAAAAQVFAGRGARAVAPQATRSAMSHLPTRIPAWQTLSHIPHAPRFSAAQLQSLTAGVNVSSAAFYPSTRTLNPSQEPQSFTFLDIPTAESFESASDTRTPVNIIDANGNRYDPLATPLSHDPLLPQLDASERLAFEDQLTTPVTTPTPHESAQDKANIEEPVDAPAPAREFLDTEVALPFFDTDDREQATPTDNGSPSINHYFADSDAETVIGDDADTVIAQSEAPTVAMDNDNETIRANDDIANLDDVATAVPSPARSANATPVPADHFDYTMQDDLAHALNNLFQEATTASQPSSLTIIDNANRPNTPEEIRPITPPGLAPIPLAEELVDRAPVSVALQLPLAEPLPLANYPNVATPEPQYALSRVVPTAVATGATVGTALVSLRNPSARAALQRATTGVTRTLKRLHPSSTHSNGASSLVPTHHTIVPQQAVRVEYTGIRFTQPTTNIVTPLHFARPFPEFPSQRINHRGHTSATIQHTMPTPYKSPTKHPRTTPKKKIHTTSPTQAIHQGEQPLRQEPHEIIRPQEAEQLQPHRAEEVEIAEIIAEHPYRPEVRPEEPAPIHETPRNTLQEPLPEEPAPAERQEIIPEPARAEVEPVHPEEVREELRHPHEPGVMVEQQIAEVVHEARPVPAPRPNTLVRELPFYTSETVMEVPQPLEAQFVRPHRQPRAPQQVAPEAEVVEFIDAVRAPVARPVPIPRPNTLVRELPFYTSETVMEAPQPLEAEFVRPHRQPRAVQPPIPAPRPARPAQIPVQPIPAARPAALQAPQRPQAAPRIPRSPVPAPRRGIALARPVANGLGHALPIVRPRPIPAARPPRVAPPVPAPRHMPAPAALIGGMAPILPAVAPAAVAPAVPAAAPVNPAPVVDEPLEENDIDADEPSVRREEKDDYLADKDAPTKLIPTKKKTKSSPLMDQDSPSTDKISSGFTRANDIAPYEIDLLNGKSSHVVIAHGTPGADIETHFLKNTSEDAQALLPSKTVCSGIGRGTSRVKTSHPTKTLDDKEGTSFTYKPLLAGKEKNAAEGQSITPFLSHTAHAQPIVQQQVVPPHDHALDTPVLVADAVLDTVVSVGSCPNINPLTTLFASTVGSLFTFIS